MEACATRDVYFGPALGPAGLAPNQRCMQAGPQRPTGLAGVWMDLDFGNVGHKREALPPTVESALALLDSSMPPTWEIHTGGGIHAWWVFKEPWLFEGEDAERAAKLVAGWQHAIQGRARAAGFSADSTFDLPHILRVPGTYNRKEAAPRLVRVMQQRARKYDWTEMEEYLAEFAPKAASSSVLVMVSTDGWVLSPERKAPADKFAAIYENSDVFRKSWEHERPDLMDQTRTGYESSLAALAVQANWDDQEIVDLLVEHYRKYPKAGDKPTRALSYYRSTISKAREFVANRKERQERPPEPPAPPTGGGDEPPFLAYWREVVGVGVKDAYRIGIDYPSFVIETEAGTVAFDSIGDLAVQAAFRLRISATLKRVPKQLKPGNWDTFLQAMLNYMGDRDAGTENDPIEQLKQWIETHLAKTAVRPSFKAMCEEPGAADELFRFPWKRADGRICVSTALIVERIRKIYGAGITNMQASSRMQRMGAELVKKKIPTGGVQSYFALPEEWRHEKKELAHEEVD